MFTVCGSEALGLTGELAGAEVPFSLPLRAGAEAPAQPAPASERSAISTIRELRGFITSLGKYGSKTPLYSPVTPLVTLEQPDNVAVFVDIHAFRGRMFGKRRHRPHIAADRINKSGTNACSHLADRQRKAGRRAFKLRIVA